MLNVFVVFTILIITILFTGIAGPTIHTGATDILRGIILIGHGDTVLPTGVGAGEAAGITDPTIPGDILHSMVDITEDTTEDIMGMEVILITAIMVTVDTTEDTITLPGIGIQTITSMEKEEQREKK